MEELISFEFWHWLIVAFVLLGIEALGAGGFFLGAAGAAVLVAFCAWLGWVTGWSGQLVLFGVFTLVFTVVYWKVFRKVNEKTDAVGLNDRASQLIGRSALIEEDMPDGRGKVQIGDTLWKVESLTALNPGDRVSVVGSRGMVLLVEKNND
ncbi:NfeD family protein [Candidatus Sororendozoicomonas aggregata]|uniref:NfeD family protein n=1 Tax=Candidatus Sororendozoicomonas aggregata TaxID=3073239 RepID=UPI002ECFFC01